MKLKQLLLAAVAVLLVGCVDIPKEPDMTLELPAATTEQVWESENYKGQPILVSFMSTSCPYCKMSLPALDAATETFAGKNVQIVGIFVDADLPTVQKVMKEHNVKSNILYDGGDAAGEMGVTGFPQIMLFDKNHKLVKIWHGFASDLKDQFESEIKKVL